MTDDIGLQAIRLALTELSNELLAHEVDFTKAQGAEITITPGQGDFEDPTSSIDKPVGLVSPIGLYRKDGPYDWEEVDKEEDEYIDFNLNPSPNITTWAYRNGRIHFNPINQENVIRLRYHKSLLDVESLNDEIGMDIAKNFLVAKTAYFVATFIGRQSDVTFNCIKDAQAGLDLVLRIHVTDREPIIRGGVKKSESLYGDDGGVIVRF